MNEYGIRESWTKILIYEFGKFPYMGPIFLCDNGKFLLVSLHRMMIYDIQEKSFSKSIDISHDPEYYYMNNVGGAYVESLVSPRYNWKSQKSTNPTEGICINLV